MTKKNPNPADRKVDGNLPINCSPFVQDRSVKVPYMTMAVTALK